MILRENLVGALTRKGYLAKGFVNFVALTKPQRHNNEFIINPLLVGCADYLTMLAYEQYGKNTTHIRFLPATLRAELFADIANEASQSNGSFSATDEHVLIVEHWFITFMTPANPTPLLRLINETEEKHQQSVAGIICIADHSPKQRVGKTPVLSVVHAPQAG
jgi:hypothetical protein